MQSYRGRGGLSKKNPNSLNFIIPTFIKQELDNLKTKSTALKSKTMKPKNHEQEISSRTL